MFTAWIKITYNLNYKGKINITIFFSKSLKINKISIQSQNLRKHIPTRTFQGPREFDQVSGTQKLGFELSAFCMFALFNFTMVDLRV